MKALHTSALWKTPRRAPKTFKGDVMPGFQYLKDYQNQAQGQTFPEGGCGRCGSVWGRTFWLLHPFRGVMRH